MPCSPSWLARSATAVVLTWLAAVLIGCATPPKLDTSQVTSQLTPDAAVAVEAAGQGAVVQWGGQILSVHNERDTTQLRILSFPLRSSGNPDERRKPTGRFLLIYSGYLEPVDFARGRFVTAVGAIRGTTTERVDKTEYPIPVLVATQIHLWRQDDRPARGYMHFGIGIGIGL